MWNGTENGIRIVVRHPVPSLNRLFAMNPWQRRREKQATKVPEIVVRKLRGL